MILVTHERMLTLLKRFETEVNNSDEFAGDKQYLNLRKEILDTFDEMEHRIDTVLTEMKEQEYAWNTRVAEFVMSLKIEVGLEWTRHQMLHLSSIDRYNRIQKAQQQEEQ
jgi:hypothetical protein